MRTVNTVGIAGTGVIGSAWAARAMFHGMDVLAFDPAPGAEEAMREQLEVIASQFASSLRDVTAIDEAQRQYQRRMVASANGRRTDYRTT